MNIHVDTLEYAKDLEKAGIAREHAEASARLQAKTVIDLVEHELVTKDFLRSELVQVEAHLRTEIVQTEARIRTDMGDLESRLRTGIAEQGTDLRTEMARMEARIVTQLRHEITSESANNRQQQDQLMLRIRALQMGGAIAAFALGAIVLMARLIR